MSNSAASGSACVNRAQHSPVWGRHKQPLSPFFFPPSFHFFLLCRTLSQASHLSVGHCAVILSLSPATSAALSYHFGIPPIAPTLVPFIVPRWCSSYSFLFSPSLFFLPSSLSHHRAHHQCTVSKKACSQNLLKQSLSVCWLIYLLSCRTTIPHLRHSSWGYHGNLVCLPKHT